MKIFTVRNISMDSNKVLSRQKTPKNESQVLVTQRNFPHCLRDQDQYDATIWQRTHAVRQIDRQTDCYSATILKDTQVNARR